MKGSKLLATTSARILACGYPGAGKTGSLAALANAGYKLRVMAFDRLANMAPLLQFTEPDKRDNIDIVMFEDKLRAGQKFMEAAGIPQAFSGALQMMDHWKYKDGDEEVDLGFPNKDWGDDTVVVIDSLTAMGVAAKRRAMAMLNKTPLNTTKQVWGLAMADQEAFIEKLTSGANRFHVVVLSHLKMIGPETEEAADTDLNAEIKKQKGGLMETRLFPSALGRQLPQQIAQYFPTVVLVKPVFRGSQVRRVIRTMAMPELDLKVSGKDVQAEYPISTGMLDVLKAVTLGG